MPRPAKPCTVCGLPKSQCRSRLGLHQNWTPDPRGISSAAGLSRLPDPILEGIAHGRAGEGESVTRLATSILTERRNLRATADRLPLWALSPYEQTLARAKGTPLTQTGGFTRL